MAVLSQTPGNVAKTATTRVIPITLGEGADAGMPVYKSSTDGLYYKTNAITSEETSDGEFILLETGVTSDVVFGAYSGDLNIGATLVIGTPYVVSNTTGKIMPAADLITETGALYITHLGYATTTSLLRIKIIHVDGITV